MHPICTYIVHCNVYFSCTVLLLISSKANSFNFSLQTRILSRWASNTHSLFSSLSDYIFSRHRLKADNSLQYFHLIPFFCYLTLAHLNSYKFSLVVGIVLNWTKLKHVLRNVRQQKMKWQQMHVRATKLHGNGFANNAILKKWQV